MTERSLSNTEKRDFVQRLFIEQVVELRRFVTSLTPDMDLVDDIVQEAFLAVTAEAHTYDPRASFTKWLQDVARRKIIQVGYRAAAGGQPFAEEVLEVLGASRPESPSSAARRLVLDECIALLAPQARRILELRYRYGMKPREVAKAVGWTSASVHVALSRARAMIRECVDGKVAALPEG